MRESDAWAYHAVGSFKEERVQTILADLRTQADALRNAISEELCGERGPDDPAELVKRIRGVRKELMRLLDEAEACGIEDPLVKRLRAAHPSRAAT